MHTTEDLFLCEQPNWEPNWFCKTVKKIIDVLCEMALHIMAAQSKTKQRNCDLTAIWL